MPSEPPGKRTHVFIDGQNLFHAAKEAFGYNYPNYDIGKLAREQNRWVKIASAYPVSPTTHNRRGINNTDWIRIDRKTYDACIDLNDYRPEKGQK